MHALRLLPPPMNFAELLRTVGRPSDVIPNGLMEAAGWSHLATFSFATVPAPDVAAIRACVDGAILAVFPDTVRLTADHDAELLHLWRHPNPPTVSTEAFPSRVDIEHALRVLQAVGTARTDHLSQERYRAIQAKAPAGVVCDLTTALNNEQALFEHMAEILGKFREP